MNINRIKSFTWLAALTVGGLLGWRVYEFLEHRGELSAGVSLAEQRAVLDNIEATEKPKDDVVAYTLVQRVFHTMNWTGKELPKPASTPDPEQIEQQRKPVSDALKVMMVQVDVEDAAGSQAYVKYIDGQLIAASTANPDLRILTVGTTLLAPFQYAEVEEIVADGVRFSIEPVDGEELEPELVPTVTFPVTTSIVKVGEDGEPLVQDNSTGVPVRHAGRFQPERTTRVGKHRWLIGTEDAAAWNTDYTKILSRDVRYAHYRSPRTGQVEGIQIKHVVPGSLPASHGVTKGEIIKSINGHKVTSVNEAIAYVKQESDHTFVWVVEIEKGGRTFYRTYETPED